MIKKPNQITPLCTKGDPIHCVITSQTKYSEPGPIMDDINFCRDMLIAHFGCFFYYGLWREVVVSFSIQPIYLQILRRHCCLHRPLWFLDLWSPPKSAFPKENKFPNFILHFPQSNYSLPKMEMSSLLPLNLCFASFLSKPGSQNGGAAEDYSFRTGITNIGFSSTHSLNIITEH